MPWLRRLQLRRENYASRRGFVAAIAIYCVLVVPLILVNIFVSAPLLVHVTLAVAVLFTVVDMRILRRHRPRGEHE